MVLSKKRIILAAGLGLALTALAVDRLLLGSGPTRPDRAEASTVPTGAPGRPTSDRPSPAEGSLPGTLVPQPALADRLQEFAEAEGLDALAVRDAFCPSEAWIAPPQPPPAPQRSEEARARAFLQQHKLTATAMNGQESVAIVDGRCLLIGQELDGFRLVAVDGHSAVLVCEGAEVTLRLPKDGWPDPQR